MTISTRLTELLEIKHPLLLAPMDTISSGALAAAVSNAGGFGIIGGGYGDEARLACDLDAAGKARIGIGFITWSMAKNARLLDLALERKPAAIMLSFGEVTPHAERIKRAGALLICQVQSVVQAKEVVARGADAIVAQGSEAGGHGGARATFPLIPAVVDAAGAVPVIAAGGIADGRGLAAALMLGADGALMGTRFLASTEAATTAEAKQRVVAADGDSTIRSTLFDIVRRREWPAPYTGRALQNEFTARWRGREAELMHNLTREEVTYEEARKRGDLDTAVLHAGEAVDLIDEVLPAAEIVARTIDGATRLIAGASNRYKATE
ncbi:MAG TPA: nitronate monooxygenase [Pseudolabrys sp.]